MTWNAIAVAFLIANWTSSMRLWTSACVLAAHIAKPRGHAFWDGIGFISLPVGGWVRLWVAHFCAPAAKKHNSESRHNNGILCATPSVSATLAAPRPLPVPFTAGVATTPPAANATNTANATNATAGHRTLLTAPWANPAFNGVPPTCMDAFAVDSRDGTRGSLPPCYQKQNKTPLKVHI